MQLGAALITALLESKYRIPTRRPNAVTRPRLAGRLTAATLLPVTMVSAPAGFGKTTCLIEWLATLPVDAPSTAWLSLDARDNDPALFWTYVIAAIQTVADGVGTDALPLLTSSAASTEAALDTLLNDLSRLPSDLLLVLDDYHLIESRDVHDALTFLVEHQPPRLHLVLLTRVDPPLPLARLRAEGRLVEVRAGDLRFTAEESVAYLNGPMGLELSADDVVRLDARTEGWIAALQLAALSMQDSEDVSGFIAGFAGDDRYVVDYLAEEVLDRQSVEIRDFLLKTSILERLTGSLCDAVTGQAGGKATLVALDRANLFLVPLDDQRRWYRYHHLFADVLQTHLLDERRDEVNDLHERASVWLEASNDRSSAISHALAGGGWGRAADLMELAMPVMQRERHEAELARWVHALPDDIVQARPVLAIAFVGALAQVSDFATVDRRLSDIERSLRSADGTWPQQPPAHLIVVDRVEYRSVPARIDVYRAALALSRSDLTGAKAHARQALALTPSGDHLTRAAAGALAGLASWATGDLAEAHAAYSETVDGLAGIGWLADVLGCCITLGDIRRTQGLLGDAARTYTWALDLTAPKPPGPSVRGTADMHVAMAEVLIERDDLTAAAEHLAIATSLGAYNGLPQNPYRCRVVTARIREAEDDLDGALALLDEAERLYAGDYSPNVRPVPAARARLRLRRGEVDLAAAWAAERQLAGTDGLSYLQEYEHVTLARLLLARHHAERDGTSLGEALTLLTRLMAAAEDGGRGGSLLEVLVLLALARQDQGDLPAALATLQRAVTLAQPEGYVRLFADEGAPMATLLTALARRPAAAGYIRRLLAATTRTRPPLPDGKDLVDKLSRRELDVLRWLGSDLGGPEIARQLSVSLNTVRTHTKNIYAKLGVTSRRAAVSRADELNLLPRHRRG